MAVVFIGSNFAAKYPEGGGNFSVPLQYLLGLRRLKRRAVWLEVMESTGDPVKDLSKARIFRSRLKDFGLERDFCLLVFPKGAKEQDPAIARNFGIPWRKIKDMLGGPNLLLDLSYSTRAPLTLAFEERKLCSLDPTEICFWMTRMEMGQSTHHEFWTIGVNTYGKGSRVPETPVKWKTYFPLIDTKTLTPVPRPVRPRFTTIGQWYFDGAVEFDGVWRDFSKQMAWEKFMDLPGKVPEGDFELAMNVPPDDPDKERVRKHGWRYVEPHSISRTPRSYYRYLAGSLAEFSAVKLESFTRSGWLSDRSAAYLAMGRPVVTESTGAEKYLPKESGFFFVKDLEEAAEACRLVVKDWKRLSKVSRACAVECFDAPKNLRKILNG